MTSEVEAVKSKVDIVGVIGSRVTLKPAGKYMKGLCPFHGERSPSFFVSPEMQIFKCFGCGKGGDVFTFLEEYEGMSFREALVELAEKVGITLSAREADSGQDSNRTQLLSVLSQATELYQYLLTSHPSGAAARAYLTERGIDQVLIDQYGLGWAPTQWRVLTTYLTEKKRLAPEIVEAAGLSIKSRSGAWFDRFRGRLIFPLTDFRGQVVGFSGRLIEAREDEPKYTNTPETSVFHKRQLLFGIDKARSYIKKKDQVVLVEGEFDVLASVKAGVRYVVGIKGTALTDEQVALLLRLTKTIVLCLDVDAAGDAATRRAIEIASQTGAEVRILRVPGGKDPDELVRESPQAFRTLVETKQLAIYQFLLESSLARHNPEDVNGQKQIVNDLVPVWAKIPHAVEQAYYVKRLAEALRVSENVIETEIAKYRRTGKTTPIAAPNPTDQVEPSSLEQLQRYGLSLWLQLPTNQALELVPMVAEIAWSLPSFQEVVKARAQFFAKKSSGTLREFSESLPAHLSELVASLLMNERVIKLEASRYQEELGVVLKRLTHASIKAKLGQLRRQIADLEQDKPGSEVLLLLQQQVLELTNQLRVESTTSA